MKKSFYLLVFILVAAATLSACRRNTYRANVSGIKADVEIKRLEIDLFTADPAAIPSSWQSLAEKYGTFLRYFSYVINIGEPGDSLWKDGLLRFCTDKLNNEVYGSVKDVFSDVRFIEKGLSDAFRRFLYFFPGRTVPSVITCITGFNNSIIAGDSVIGISLDRYLGKDYRYYPMLGLFNYQIVKMTPENIIPDVIYAWISSEWDYASSGYTTDNVLSEILHEGKLLYTKKSLLPKLSDELLFGFTTEQMKFCRANEGTMWQYLIEHNLLFSTDQLTRKRLTGEAPFTTYFSRESPGRAAAWVGFRIIESFMRNNREVTLEELFKENDPQNILGRARYAPRY